MTWTPEYSYPFAPMNPQVLQTEKRGVLDLRWDDPSLISYNNSYNIVGVNVYRSEDSDKGPYFKINDFPVSSNFYRDATDIVFIDRELVLWDSSWVYKGDDKYKSAWQFKTANPMYKRHSFAPYQESTYANSPKDVEVFINGSLARVSSVQGRAQDVFLDSTGFFEVSTENNIITLPNQTDTVEISYWTLKNYIPSGLDKTIWYRVVTVALDSNGDYIETPLNRCKPTSIIEVESLDYIWREAVRRNNWILQQGGERVKAFIRKTSGLLCDCCYDPKRLDFSKQPSAFCKTCFGTGYRGGYEGPYEVIIAPDDAERRISQSQFGRRKEHTYEVWTGPSPLLTQRDFIVKQTNERYSVGPTRRPSNRGNVLQQHFNIAYLDEGDVRYSVPLDGTDSLIFPQTRGVEVVMPRLPVTGEPSVDEQEGWSSESYPEGPDNNMPIISEKENTPDDKEQRGRTKVWENINY